MTFLTSGEARAALVGLVLAACALQDPAPLQPERRPWLGIRMTVHDAEVRDGDRAYPRAIRVHSVETGSPADAAGLRAGDLVVLLQGADLAKPADQILAEFRRVVASAKAGDTLDVTVFRDAVDRTAALLDGKPIDNPAAAWQNPDAFLARRPAGSKLRLEAERVRGFVDLRVTLQWMPLPPTREVPPSNRLFPAGVPLLEEEQLVDAIVRKHGIYENYRDLRGRLAKLVERGDPFLLPGFAYAMREPFALAALSRRAADAPRGKADLVAHAAVWLDKDPGPFAVLPSIPAGLSPEEHAVEIEKKLAEAHKHFERAFTALSAEERAFLEQALPALGDSFIRSVMMTGDPDAERLQKVRRLVELAPRVDVRELLLAARRLCDLLDPGYLKALRADLGGATHKRDTPYGPIVFAGKGRDWHREPAAVIVDQGGDDLYTMRTRKPFSIVIDFEGDDAYEASFDGSHGAGILGVSIVHDLAGEDSYIGRRWTQGAAAFGVGILWDVAGDDTYRASDFAQGAAVCGAGLLVDEGGNDRYDAPRYAQGLGMPGGFGALIDRAGGDRYFCKGRDQTGYGEEGMFEGWGQGCGIGFRGMISGGIGLLLDDDGDDVYEGGHFTQGGGYAYGWGILVDRRGDDRYIGSRYAQAFSAHQALGYLEDHAGNDRYTTRHGVAQSCSWDQTVTVFIDRAGDDLYEGGGFFSQGASAHNGIALFLDYGGDDRYDYAPGQAKAGPNDYHGGTSFSLFVDYGGGVGRPWKVEFAPAHGAAVWAPGNLSEAVQELDN